MTTEFQCCGCMLAAGNTYANTCAPEDVWKSMEKDREKEYCGEAAGSGVEGCLCTKAGRYSRMT